MFYNRSFFLLPWRMGKNMVSVFYHTGLWKRLDMDTDNFLKAHRRFLSPLLLVFLRQTHYVALAGLEFAE